MNKYKWTFTEWDAPGKIDGNKIARWLFWAAWYRRSGELGSFRLFGFRWNREKVKP